MADIATAAANRGGKSSGVGGIGDTAWIGIQANTFKNWMNTQLSKVGSKIDNLEEDFKNGVAILQTLEQCSGKSVGKYNKNAKLPVQQVENLNTALDFIKREGMKLVNIGAPELQSGNLKLVLGLIWTIIYHYQVSKGFKNAGQAHGKKGGAKDMLLEWVRSKIPEYDIKNFKSNWNDGRAICALTNAVGGEPALIPNHQEMHPENKVRNAQTGIDTAYENLGIPKLISAADLTNPAVDDLSVVTYVSYFRDAKRKSAAPKPPTHKQVAEEPKKEEEAAPPPKVKSQAGLPPPWERDADWRVYEGPDLGGRCKIRVYFSTTTSSQKVRQDWMALQNFLERHNVHKRPDFEPAIPIDIDMTKETRDKIFEKAGTKKTPMLFIDDEYIGGWDEVSQMNETGEIASKLEY
eukprot:m.264383 g.264383  ORF g.264383 m.264383 type:complete len:407 (-) comp27777_c0_seq1:167-1387(-)